MRELWEEVYESIFKTQDEAMTQAAQLAHSGYVKRPYVFRGRLSGNWIITKKRPKR